MLRPRAHDLYFVPAQDDGQRHVILNHKKHIRAVVCPAFHPKCDPIVVCVGLREGGGGAVPHTGRCSP